MGELVRLFHYTGLNSISTKALSNGKSHYLLRHFDNLSNFHRINNPFNIYNLQFNGFILIARPFSHVSVKSKQTNVNITSLPSQPTSNTIEHLNQPSISKETTSDQFNLLCEKKNLTSKQCGVLRSVQQSNVSARTYLNQPQGKPENCSLLLQAASGLSKLISARINTVQTIDKNNFNYVNQTVIDTTINMGLSHSKKIASNGACTNCSTLNHDSGRNNNYNICGVYRTTACLGNPIFSSSKRCLSTSVRMSDYKNIEVLTNNRLNKVRFTHQFL